MKALMILAAIGAAQQPAQFDLVCKGAGGPDAKTGIVFDPVELHLRVDLAAAKWCEGDCKIIAPIADVQPGRIWFEKQSQYEAARQIVHFRTVDRETGQYMQIEEGRFGTARHLGDCQAAAFSGFPRLDTKF